MLTKNKPSCPVVTPFVLLAVLLASHQSIGAEATREKGQTGTVYLKNGDYVRGTFAPTADANGLNWTSKSFRQPLEFDLRGVDYVSFVGPPAVPTPSQNARPTRQNPLARKLRGLLRAIPTPPPAAAKKADGKRGGRIQLVNDNIVFGELVALDETTLTVNSPHHGSLKLRREFVMEVDGVSDSASLVFDGATSLSTWASFGANKQSVGQWAVAGGGLSTQVEGAAIYGKHPALDRLVCEVELSGKQKPGFQVTIGANKLPRSLKSGFTLEVWGRQLVLHRQTGSELKHVVLEMPKLAGAKWRVALQLYVDVKKKTVVAYSRGKKVGELEMPESDRVSIPGTGVVVRNRSDQLNVTELRIRRWTGPIQNATTENDMVVMNDGTWSEGKIKSVSGEERTLVIEVDGEENEHKLADIDQLRFRRLDTIPAAPDTDDVRVSYLDGGAVSGRYLKIDDSSIWMQSQVSDEPIRMAINGMANVRFDSADPPKINPRKTGLVEFFGCRVHGRVVNSEDEQELEWESVFSTQPVRFSSGAMTRVSFEPTQHDLGLNRLYSELALTNGDRIPCDVDYVDHERIVARFAGGERAVIPGKHFKALRDSREENWVYRGFQPGERWVAWKQAAGKPVELDDGTLHFYSQRLLAKEFRDLPDLARISFDIRFGRDGGFVIGYGADKPMHAVRPVNTYSYNQEELKKAAKQRPDSLIEVTLQKTGSTLQAQGVSRVAGVLGMIMGHRGGSPRRSPKPLKLDDNAVAHIDILIDRSAREFAVFGNGKELYRWREPSPLEGIFLHLGTSNSNTPTVGQSTKPIISIFNFRIARWPGEMPEDHRERFLTRRMGARRKATTHVVRAANGDNLRGQLIQVEEDVVLFKSRLRTYRIDRNKVVEIIALELPQDDDGSDGDDERVQETAQHDHDHDHDHGHDHDHQHVVVATEGADNSHASDSSSASDRERLTRVRLWGGGTVSLMKVRADEEMVVGASPIVGPVSIPWEAIAAIDFAGSPEPDPAFTKWVLRDPPPLPEATQQSPNQPADSPWLNKPAPDFEVALNDGRRVALSDFKGKAVMLDFWATWCGPCLASMPSVMELADEMGDEMQLIAVNMGEEPDEVKEFLEARLWELTVGFDQSGAIGRTFGVTSIPCTMVIDAEGIVRHVHVGASPTLKQDLKAVLEKL